MDINWIKEKLVFHQARLHEYTMLVDEQHQKGKVSRIATYWKGFHRGSIRILEDVLEEFE